jgi:hypothetical protein
LSKFAVESIRVLAFDAEETCESERLKSSSIIWVRIETNNRSETDADQVEHLLTLLQTYIDSGHSTPG